MADEEFHEIQLNGKQLVFLFMAGTVAAVVIFLCGLMVGRNLRVPRLEAAAATTDATVVDPTRPPEQAALPPPSDTSATGAPVTTRETLTYPSRLEDPVPAEETLRPGDTPPKPAAPVAKPPAKDAAPKTTASKDAPAANAEPAGNGWVVQVQAVTSRGEADALAKRLSAKGYPTFVTPRPSGNFGVRVGKFDKKSDAEAVKARLEKEEQLKPWVTR
jgi:cell division septation protein DedD